MWNPFKFRFFGTLILQYVSVDCCFGFSFVSTSCLNRIRRRICNFAKLDLRVLHFHPSLCFKANSKKVVIYYPLAIKLGFYKKIKKSSWLNYLRSKPVIKPATTSQRSCHKSLNWISIKRWNMRVSCPNQKVYHTPIRKYNRPEAARGTRNFYKNCSKLRNLQFLRNY